MAGAPSQAWRTAAPAWPAAACRRSPRRATARSAGARAFFGRHGGHCSCGPSCQMAVAMCRSRGIGVYTSPLQARARRLVAARREKTQAGPPWLGVPSPGLLRFNRCLLRGSQPRLRTAASWWSPAGCRWTGSRGRTAGRNGSGARAALVTALEPVMREAGGAWIGWSGDAGPAPGAFEADGLHLVGLGLSENEVSSSTRVSATRRCGRSTTTSSRRPSSTAGGGRRT